MTARIPLIVAILVWIAPLPTAAHDITVHRGAETTTAFQPTAPAGATVVARGTGVKPRVGSTADLPDGRVDRSIPVVAGDRLWLIDTAADRLTVCTLRGTTQVGRDVIRCRHRTLPR